MRDFLKHTFATLFGILIFLGLSFGGLLLLIIATASKDTEPQVKDKSVLVFDLSQNIADSQPNSSTRQAINEALSGDETDTITLKTVLDTIDQATQDSKIVALYLHGGDGASTSGFATLKEVRDALQRFKASGKKIYAYDVDWSERKYYLGSVADTIAINPIGDMEINGFSSEGLFFAGALQKYGVGIQVTRVGKYKSAVEPFLMTKRSPENREQTQELLGDLWSEFLSATSKARKMTTQQMQAIADSKGFLTAEEALKAKLADKIAYSDQMVSELKKISGEDGETKSFRQINLKAYAKIAEAEVQKQGGKHQIAVVYAEGDIVNGQGGDRNVGGDRLARQLRQLRQDDDVKAVVLRINSPGGSATASEIIQREVILTQKAKPFVVSMGNVAASGGYWIATYADRIFAEPNTITGSIGVFGLQPNIQKIANQNGLTWDVVKTGRFADSQTITRPKRPEELKLVQRSVDKIYDQFLTKVSNSRKLQKNKVAEIAQGRVWSGAQAKSLGLVDELGGLNAAIQDAAKRAKLGDDWQIEEYPKTSTFEERLLKRLIGATLTTSAPTSDPLTQEFKKLQSDLTSLANMNDPTGVYVRLPLNLRID
ncbi:MAG: signal peptide peptidase SppA [Leptolyngbyaceae cyanobacterium CSU_1_3]|nr:signal peptide peptidase SppA [Leptolyngbyaceae cyanobacterium CSU_1_3]